MKTVEQCGAVQADVTVLLFDDEGNAFNSKFTLRESSKRLNLMHFWLKNSPSRVNGLGINKKLMEFIGQCFRLENVLLENQGHIQLYLLSERAVNDRLDLFFIT